MLLEKQRDIVAEAKILVSEAKRYWSQKHEIMVAEEN